MSHRQTVKSMVLRLEPVTFEALCRASDAAHLSRESFVRGLVRKAVLSDQEREDVEGKGWSSIGKRGIMAERVYMGNRYTGEARADARIKNKVAKLTEAEKKDAQGRSWDRTPAVAGQSRPRKKRPAGKVISPRARARPGRSTRPAARRR